MRQTCCVALLILSVAGTVSGEPWKKASDPTRFDSAIAAFEAADSTSPPPTGAIVCIGSSSMRGWHKRIAEDLQPLTVIPRGFGGSTYYDALHYADRIVLQYEPRAVLVYEGDNDVAAGIPAQQIEATFRAFVTRLRARLPEVRIYAIGAKPSIARWDMWPQMVEANSLVQAVCDADPQLTYIDVADVMLQPDGTPRPEIFVDDMLHMNDAGYDAWTQAVAPALLAGEAQYE